MHAAEGVASSPLMLGHLGDLLHDGFNGMGWCVGSDMSWNYFLRDVVW